MAAPPFALLDDPELGPAGGPAGAWLMEGPSEVISARTLAEVGPALAAMDAASAEGRWLAGFLAYEAGLALDPALAGLGETARALPHGLPLLWFGCFERATPLAPEAVARWLTDGRSPARAPAPPVPRITPVAHRRAVAAVQALITAGDVYQINLTFPADVPLREDPVAHYADLRVRARAGEGGLIWTGAHWVLSQSPELFFHRRGDMLLARPMKGTAPRMADPAADRAAAEALAADPKQRAENLMIVDLIRNDVARVAVAGSVAVPRLFAVQSLPTVHQLVSDVTARLAAGTTTGDILRAMFPCGSVTGAPKLRAIGAIGAIEGAARGLYTGSLGLIRPGGDARFNVAIRTLVLGAGEQVATLGLGSGIVADSLADDEWDECLAKGRFVTASGPRDTMASGNE